MNQSAKSASKTDPAIKKRGGDPDVKVPPARDRAKEKAERDLEEGLEESMAGSDAVSITQPVPPEKDDKQKG